MSLPLAALDGRVILKGFLGEGGMGQVHRAWDQGLERSVAVKFLRGTDPREAERLLLEARLQARVDHPHVVKVHEVGTLEGRPCIVLQLVDGRSLSALQQELPLTAKVELLRQVAEGLHAAHRQGLLHRDIKPSNVLVEETSEGMRALVSDFGLARDQEGGLTRSGFPAGTMEFMSPEQLLGRGPLDSRSDVYALGATLYTLLAGHPPYRDHQTQLTPGGLATPPSATGLEAPSRLLHRILEEEPPSLRGAVPDLPRDLALIVAKAMEKDPAQRYASAEAFAEDLAHFQRGEPIVAQAPGLLEGVLRWKQRHRTEARALGAVGLLVLLGLGWTIWVARRAGVEGLEAASLGALAEALEAQVRMEMLSPPHDLRPVLASVRLEVEALRSLALRPRGGPAAFALGKGLELLGDLDGARDAYERAWAQGFRTPRAAEALGLALGRVYDRDLRRAKATLSPEGLKARLPALHAQLRDPARSYLAQGDQKGWRGPWLQAFTAMLDQDYGTARERAKAVLAADPGRYEARTLEAEAWLGEAAARVQEAHLAEANTAADQAEGLLTQALSWGHSDPRIHRDLARLHTLRAQARKDSGLDPAAETAASLDWLDQAARLNPEDPALLFQHALALQMLAKHDIPAGKPGGVALIEQSIGFLDRASQQLPRDVPARLQLTHALYYRATVQRNFGKASLPLVEAALRSLETLVALAPADPDARYVAMTVHLEQALTLQALGKDAGAAFQSVLDEGGKSLDLQTSNPVGTLFVLATAQGSKGKQAWFSGQDPRADFAGGVARSEQLLKAAPNNPSVLFSVIQIQIEVADQLADLGEDAQPLLARSLAVAEEALAKHPAYAGLQSIKGSTLLLEAYRRMSVGEDPRPLAAEARQWLTRGVKGRGDPSTWLSLGVSRYTEGRWQGMRGQDPGSALAHAEGHFTAILKAQPGNAYAHQGLAQCALEHAVWRHRQGLPTQAAGAKGLAEIASSLAAEPRDPMPQVIRARLQGYAGDQAAGLASLAQAAALNSLVKRSREYRLAAEELARN
jgi:eukaryotic-like serine/threonine-protein kinase